MGSPPLDGKGGSGRAGPSYADTGRGESTGRRAHVRKSEAFASPLRGTPPRTDPPEIGEKSHLLLSTKPLILPGEMVWDWEDDSLRMTSFDDVISCRVITHQNQCLELVPFGVNVTPIRIAVLEERPRRGPLVSCCRSDSGTRRRDSRLRERAGSPLSVSCVVGVVAKLVWVCTQRVD